MPTITVPKMAVVNKIILHFLVLKLVTVNGRKISDKNPTAAIVS
jgi:hypothetical protein